MSINHSWLTDYNPNASKTGDETLNDDEVENGTSDSNQAVGDDMLLLWMVLSLSTNKKNKIDTTITEEGIMDGFNVRKRESVFRF